MMKHICPICLKGKAIPIRSVKGYHVDKLYLLYQCDNCHSRSFDLNEHPDVDLQAYYNLISKDESYLKQKFIFSKYWMNEVKSIQNIYGHMPASVLDIGCRTGDFLLHFPRDIKRVGVELSEYSAGVAEKRGLIIKQSYIENISSKDKFDTVTTYAIIEHLAKPQAFLDKVTELINTNGVLVIMIPSYQTMKARLIELANVQWHMYSPPGHLSLYSREFLDGYLTDKGFTLVKRRYTSGGMFNPFRSIPFVGRVFSKLMWILDTYCPLNRLPFFDHMYSYYVYNK